MRKAYYWYHWYDISQSSAIRIFFILFGAHIKYSTKIYQPYVISIASRALFFMRLAIELLPTHNRLGFKIYHFPKIYDPQKINFEFWFCCWKIMIFESWHSGNLAWNHLFDQIKIIQNEQGDHITPSYVAFNEKERPLSYLAKQACLIV